MLEISRLHLAAWTLDGPGQIWMRRITDAASGAVGFAVLKGTLPQGWFAWLRGVRLEIFETDDASHLMSLVRRWGILQTWEVYDAEERHVGSIYPRRLIDSDGEQRASLELLEQQRGKIINPGNLVLASFSPNPEAGLEVAFASEPEANPFLRMLLLGAILALDPLPNAMVRER